MISPESLKHLAVVDVETTGLDPDRHEIWEVALYLPDKGGIDELFTTQTDAIVHETEAAHHWFIQPDLGKADAYALTLGKFYERFRTRPYWLDLVSASLFAAKFEELTRGRHLVGNVVSFDEERLRKLLRANGACPGWHYHLVDVEAVAAGALGITPPWKSMDLSAALGVEVPSKESAHGAARDVRWAWEMYVAAIERAASSIVPLAPGDV